MCFHKHNNVTDETIRYSDYYKTCNIGEKTYIIMIVKRHNHTLKNTGSIEPVSVRTNTGPVHRISIKHERFDQRWRNVVPASSTLSKPCPSIGPNLRAWWVPRKHDTSTQCWSNVGQRLLAQHWPSTGPMYRVCRVLYHV